MDTIDFVVPWVDCNDSKWIESYNFYRPEKPIQDRAKYRNWDIFRYWFRAVEKFAPWVHKVYLITNGTFPNWINTNNEKLVLINHSEYIPKNYLPTFNSRTIELNLNHIENLSDHFVYFNDDIFINAPIEPNYYFHNGLPCDYNRETILRYPRYTKQNQFGEDLVFHFCTAIVNNHFSRKETISQAWLKWYGPHLWGKPLLSSLLLLRQRHFENFQLLHNEQPMLKSVLKEIWEQEGDLVEKSCSRFREVVQLNQYLIRYWQFASNRFYPMKRKCVAYHNYNRDILNDLIKNLKEEKFKSICINDSPFCSEEEFNYASKIIQNAFEEKFPTISSFERNVKI